MSKKPQTNLPTNPKARKERPMARGLLDYFPDALAEIANVSFVGNQQHNPGEEMHWAREKSSDHADCILRHLAERGTMDTDGLPHSAKMAWRALALLQIEVEATQARQEFDVQTYLDLNGVHPPIYAGTPTKIVALDDYRSSLTAKVNRRVYIAGPMRGIEKLNFPAFDEACMKIRPLNPSLVRLPPACLRNAIVKHLLICVVRMETQSLCFPVGHNRPGRGQSFFLRYGLGLKSLTRQL